MSTYTAPLKDLQFAIRELAGLSEVSALPGHGEVNAELVYAVLAEAGKFAQEVLDPLNREGDKQGATLADGKVTAPKGFKEAYRAFVEAGWNGLGGEPEHGGQGLPHLIDELRQRRDLLHERLARSIPGLLLNGHPEQRLPSTLNVSFPGVIGRALLHAVADSVAASVGSACHSEHDAVSGVLAAMGMDAARAAGAVRLSVGRTTREEDIHRAADCLVAAWQRMLAA